MDYFEYCGANPVVLVFARDLTEPLTRLIEGLNSRLAELKSAKARAIVVFLSNDGGLEKDLQEFATREGIKKVALAIMEPPGPKYYKLSREADVTVLLYNRQKVVVNHAFRKNGLNEKSREQVLKDVLKIIPDHDVLSE
jgi:hypothetical protein